MLPRAATLASLLAAALVTAGCGELITRYYDLTIVKRELEKSFGENVTVDVLGGKRGATFVVWFINSPLNDDTAQKREARAAEAAKIVKENYPRIQSITDMMVGFLRKKSPFDEFNQNQIVALHGFDKHGAALAGQNDDRERLADNIRVTPTHDVENNITDISVSGIQLEGKPGGMGLTVLPFFKLSGSVQTGKLPPPKTVTLNFASYAEKPRFEQTIPITFVAEGKVVLKTEGDFKGDDTQFCYLTIPYKEFHQMVNAKELTIKLGDKEFPLTPSQLGAMHAMTEYVRE